MGASGASALIESIVFNAVTPTLLSAPEATDANTAFALRESIVRAVSSRVSAADASGANITADALRQSIVKAVTQSLTVGEGRRANGANTTDALRESLVKVVTLSLLGAPVENRVELDHHDQRESERGDRGFESSYDEVRSLLHIKKDPVYSAALEEWGRKEQNLANRVDRREKRTADLTNQIYNIVGFFSVFQGVVLTAVSQLASSSGGPKCGKIWFPIVLSIVAALVTVVGVWEKFTSLRAVEKTRHDDNGARQIAAGRQERLRRLGGKFKFYEHAKGVSNYEGAAKSFLGDECSVIFTVLAFTTIIVLSYFVILCDKWVIPGWDNTTPPLSPTPSPPV